MQIYMAPLEGITGSIFRNTYQEHFYPFDKLFTPFFGNTGFNTKEMRDIEAQNNRSVPLIPQILSNDADDFLIIAGKMSEYGYTSVNLNLGCPSGTVTGKGRGSGFLRDLDKLNRFLDRIYRESPLPISIKTRIGYDTDEHWPELLAIYNSYPVTELIVHPRLKTDMYKPPLRLSAFAYAYDNAKMPLVYNGDICTTDDYNRIINHYPNLKAVMIGRGILKNPGLIGEIHGLPPVEDAAILAWLEALKASNLAAYTETPTLFKLKEIWTYLKTHYPDSQKEIKQLFKARKMYEYDAALSSIFR